MNQENWNEERFVEALNYALGKLKKTTLILKPEQMKTIKEFILGNHVFLSLPTGSGKSLCFQVLPFMYEHLTKNPECFIFVVSPLVSLVNNQLKKLADPSFATAFVSEINRQVTLEEPKHLKGKKGRKGEALIQWRTERIAKIVSSSKYRLIYATPESFIDHPDWLSVFQSDYWKKNNCGSVIDEAHCVLKWKEFRPKYDELDTWAAVVQKQIMAVTATSTVQVRDIVKKILRLFFKLIEGFVVFIVEYFFLVKLPKPLYQI